MAPGQLNTLESRPSRKSRWNLGGTLGPPVAEAYVAFWFAWVAFHPQTGLHGRPVDEVTVVPGRTLDGEGGSPDGTGARAGSTAPMRTRHVGCGPACAYAEWVA